VSRYFLAFDLGAESGRAMLGRLRGGVIDVQEVHRFANDAVRQNGSLQWDILRIWQEMRRALDLVTVPIESVGVDTWESTTRCSARTATCSRIRITIATRAPKG